MNLTRENFGDRIDRAMKRIFSGCDVQSDAAPENGALQAWAKVSGIKKDSHFFFGQVEKALQIYVDASTRLVTLQRTCDLGSNKFDPESGIDVACPGCLIRLTFQIEPFSGFRTAGSGKWAESDGVIELDEL